MNPIKMIAILLVIAGGLGLAYGGFSYTKESHTADIGGLELSIDEEENVNIPVWLGVGAIVGGLLLFGVASKS